MLIGGFQKFSLIDYPGKICSIVFTLGCNFRCPYCHNPELVVPEKFSDRVEQEEIFLFLEKRRGRVDAVTITGGEPTIQPGLVNFLKKIKGLGFLIKLDTNGSRPEVIRDLIGLDLVDYFAMDVKAPLAKYSSLGVFGTGPEKISRSIKLIMDSGADYEFRTTVLKPLLSKKDILEIGPLLMGAELYFLQKFVPTKVLNQDCLAQSTYSDEEFEELRKTLEDFVKNCRIR